MKKEDIIVRITEMEVKRKEYTKEDSNNLYKHIKENNDDIFVEEIYKTIEKKSKSSNKSLDNLIKKYSENLNYIDDKEKKEFFTIYLSIFIYNALLENTHKTDKEENITLSSDYNLINNITTSLKKILIEAEMLSKTKIEIINDEIKKIAFATLIILEQNKILIRKNFIFEKKKYINFEKNFKKLKKKKISIFKKPFTIYTRNAKSEKDSEFYIYSQTYDSIDNIYKNNQYSGKIFKTNEESQILNELCNNSVYISKSKLEEVINEYLKEEDMSIEELKRTINELKNEMSEERSVNIKNIKNKISRLSTLERLEHLHDLKEYLEDEDTKIYLPFIIDFRGRLYYTSHASPTNYKELRVCMHYGNIKNEDKKYSSLLWKVELIMEGYHYMVREWEKKDRTNVLWMFLSIGEINKNKLSTNSGKVRIETFIEEAIEIYNKEDYNEYSIENRLKIKHIKNIIKDLKEKREVKKWLISKDATASCYQHLIKILGKNYTEGDTWCNLSSEDTWYDTYAFIITSFFEKEDINTELKKYFTRDTLKRTIMTHNYGSSLQRCEEYFYKTLYNKYEKEEIDIKKNELNDIFRRFYRKLNDGAILKRSPKELTERFKKNTIINFKNESIDLEYNKIKNKQVNIWVNKKRYSKEYKFLTDIKDSRKFKQSLRANYIQSHDGYLVRRIIERTKCLTIHDCFMYPWSESSYIISIINEEMQEVFHDNQIESNIEHKKIFSIFIIL